MADETPKPEELAKIDHNPPLWKGWMHEPAQIRRGIACYAANPKNLEYVDFPNARDWSPLDEDCKLPEN
jgi:hypothetical protein